MLILILQSNSGVHVVFLAFLDLAKNLLRSIEAMLLTSCCVLKGIVSVVLHVCLLYCSNIVRVWH